MRKLTLLLCLALPACGSQQQMAERHAAIQQANANALSRIEGHCTSTGHALSNSAYVDCLRSTASGQGYALAEASMDGKQITVVPADKGIAGYPVPPSAHTPTSWH